MKLDIRTLVQYITMFTTQSSEPHTASDLAYYKTYNSQDTDPIARSESGNSQDEPQQPVSRTKRMSIGVSLSDPSFDLTLAELRRRQRQTDDDASAGGGAVVSTWKQKLREPSTIIQATVLKEKAQNVKRLMHTVRLTHIY